MAHSKTIQFYRNNTVIRPNTSSNKTALTVAKETLANVTGTNDGEITLVRYKEGDNDDIKTLLGIKYKNGNNGYFTYITEFDSNAYYTKDEIDDNELVVASALTELDEMLQDLEQSIPTALADLTDDSTHRVVTDAEKTAWDSKAEKVTLVTPMVAGNVSQELAPNTFYKFGQLNSLTLTLASGTGFSIYAGKFTASSSWGGSGLSVPATVSEASSNDEIEVGHTYEFSILDNIILVKKVS